MDLILVYLTLRGGESAGILLSEIAALTSWTYHDQEKGTRIYLKTRGLHFDTNLSVVKVVEAMQDALKERMTE